MILDFVGKQKFLGIKNIVLLGEDDITFIIEYACQKNNLSFCNVKDINNDFNIENNTLFLLSETFSKENCPEEIFAHSVINVMDILLEK